VYVTHTIKPPVTVAVTVNHFQIPLDPNPLDSLA
jgi:hypothetical protein